MAVKRSTESSILKQIRSLEYEIKWYEDSLLHFERAGKKSNGTFEKMIEKKRAQMSDLKKQLDSMPSQSTLF